MNQQQLNPLAEGKRIYELIFQRNEDVGATVCEISGGQGSTKTSACLNIAEEIMKRYQDELVFWRESIKSPIQFTKIQKHPYKIFIEKGYNLIWKSVTTNLNIRPKFYTFSSIEDVVMNAEKKTLNVIFFKSRKGWTDLIAYLNIFPGWQTVILDEYEDIYPAYLDNKTEEKWWDWIQYSADTIKQCRKGYTTVIGNCHKGKSIDFRIRDKIMIYMYGFGAIPDVHSRVKKEAIDVLEKGEFWITEEHRRFGKIKFKRVYTPAEDIWTVYEQNE